MYVCHNGIFYGTFKYFYTFTIFSEFFIRWPRNFCAAFFLNILVAGPISRTLLRVIQKNESNNSKFELATVKVEKDNNEVV